MKTTMYTVKYADYKNYLNEFKTKSYNAADKTCEIECNSYMLDTFAAMITNNEMSIVEVKHLIAEILDATKNNAYELNDKDIQLLSYIIMMNTQRVTFSKFKANVAINTMIKSFVSRAFYGWSLLSNEYADNHNKIKALQYAVLLNDEQLYIDNYNDLVEDKTYDDFLDDLEEIMPKEQETVEEISEEPTAIVTETITEETTETVNNEEKEVVTMKYMVELEYGWNETEKIDVNFLTTLVKIEKNHDLSGLTDVTVYKVDENSYMYSIDDEATKNLKEILFAFRDASCKYNKFIEQEFEKKTKMSREERKRLCEEEKKYREIL